MVIMILSEGNWAGLSYAIFLPLVLAPLVNPARLRDLSLIIIGLVFLSAAVEVVQQWLPPG
ncbi:MAG: hypothetical protein EOP02_17045 [Proteobacteria bacterium]|nr:MAG: hypothetical protein EOP02_17045 [Pseudomonadota bacterium]